MEKRVEIKMTDDLYEQIIKFCNQYSHSPSAGIRLLIKGKLDDIKIKNGVSTEIAIPPDLRLDLESVKPQGHQLSEYIIWALRGHVDYRRKYTKKPNEYFDTQNEQNENYSQEPIEKREIVLNTPRVPFEKENVFFRERYTQHESNFTPKNPNQKTVWMKEKDASDYQINLLWKKFQQENA